MSTPRLIVAQRMTRELYAVRPDTSLATVARILEMHDISGVPVIDAAGHPVGVVSQTNLLDSRRPRSRPESPSFFHKLRDGQVCATGTADQAHEAIAGTVVDVMSPTVLNIGPNATVVDAARLMLENRVHRLFVVDRGRIVGVITSTDCLSALIEALGSARTSPPR
jgi:CBS domain-containing protein